MANLLPWLYSHGGDFYNQDYAKTLVNDQKGRQALQLLTTCATGTSSPPRWTAPPSRGRPSPWPSPARGRRATCWTSNPRLQFGFAPLPKGPLGTRPSSQTWTNQWSMTKDGKRKDVAWEWLAFVNSAPVQEQYFATVMKRFSGRKSVYASQAWKTWSRTGRPWRVSRRWSPSSKQYPWVKTTPINEQTAEIWRKAQANEIGVNEALAQVEQIVNRVLSGG